MKNCKKPVFALLAVSILTAPAAYSEPVYFGPGSDKCSDFNEVSNDTDGLAYKAYLSWAMGAISGYENFCRATNHTSTCAGVALSPIIEMLGVTEYCSKRPDDTFGAGVATTYLMLLKSNKKK